MLGKTILHYKVIEKLGEGGMGVVYKAEDMKLDRFVALKFLPSHLVDDEKALNRLLKEAKSASKINHPNVCTIHAIEEYEDTHFIVMEYVDGETLRKKTVGAVGEPPFLSVDDAIDYSIQICRALKAAHDKGIIHRDIKTENIMINAENIVKVMDFGLAKLKDEAGLTKTKTAGTIAYMSPEQLQGFEIDTRTDIWSFGVVMYEILTGQLPFKGEYESAMMYSIVNTEPEPISDVPSEIEKIVTKSLAKSSNERYQHVDEMLVDLRSVSMEKATGKTEVELSKTKSFLKNRIFLYGGIALILILLIMIGRYLFTGQVEVIDSIAVLPLENISGDPEQEYFADGMTDALIAELGKIRALRVISRTSVMQYKDVRKPLPDIARELNVDAIVEGTVMRVGDRVRIVSQLVQAVPEQHLWADSYERDLSDILALQKEVARSIAREIMIAVTAEEQARMTKTRPINPEAYQAYLRGRYHWNKRTEEGLKRAIEYFQQALEKDPGYALAYAGLADSYILLPWYSTSPQKDVYPKAKEAALKSLEIDNTLAEAHTSLAYIKINYDRDWSAAEREFKRAIELNPSYATAHHWYAMNLVHMIRVDEAIAEIKLAVELDPLSLVINRNVGSVFYYARQYDQAIKAVQRSIEMDSNSPHAHLRLGQAYLQKSMFEEALAEFQKEKTISGGWLDTWIGITYVRMEKRGEAQEMLNDLIKQSKETYVPQSFLAGLYFALGENDQGFKWLEKAYEERDLWLSYIKTEPIFDSVRSDSRFTALLKKMGLDK